MSTHRQAILRLMNEYCYRIDAGDLDGFAELFAYGSFSVLGDPSGPASGKQAVLDVLANVTLYDGKPHTKHVMSNVQIDVAESADTAAAQCYIILFQALPDFPMQAIFGGHYHDRFVRENGVWRFQSREISADLIGDLSRHRADMA